MEKLWRCGGGMLEEVDITTDGENLTTQSTFSLHAVSIISPQVVCILEIAVGDAKVNRLWRNSAEYSIM